MDLLVYVLIFFSGAFFGLVLSGILSAAGREVDKEYFYNLGKEDARKEMQDEMPVK